MNANKLRWGIIGTGAIAQTFARGIAGSRTGVIAGVASRSPGLARKFGKHFAVPRAYGSYQELLGDSGIDAVYISTPHPWHAQWAIAAAEAGKHILCEKPLAMNARETQTIFDAAQRNGVFLMEAFMYRCHPQTAMVRELLAQRRIGEVRSIDASFCFNAPYDPASRLYKKDLGGGGILDVGCYCASMARMVAGCAIGKPFDEPSTISASGRIGKSGVDEYASAELFFSSGITARISCGVGAPPEMLVRINGTQGHITLTEPWVPAPEGGSSTIIVSNKDAGIPEKLIITADQGIYSIEADTVAAWIDKRQAPAMCWDDSLGNMQLLDRWQQAIGLRFPADDGMIVESQIE